MPTVSGNITVADVLDGPRRTNGFIYIARMAAGDPPPSTTDATSFDWVTGTFTSTGVPTGWSLTAPSSTTTGQLIFVSRWTAAENEDFINTTLTYSAVVEAQIVLNDVKSPNYDGSTDLSSTSTVADIGTEGYFLDASSGIFAATDIILRDIEAAGPNTRLGENAGNPRVSTGDMNISVGNNAGMSMTTGSNNVAVGQGAGSTLTTGGDNTIVGQGADVQAGTMGGVAVGHDAALTGNNAIAVGDGMTAAANSIQIGDDTHTGDVVVGPYDLADFLLTIETEGIALLEAATTLNFTGDGVIASGISTPTKTINIPGIEIREQGQPLELQSPTRILDFAGSNVTVRNQGNAKTIFVSGGFIPDIPDRTTAVVGLTAATILGGTNVITNGNPIDAGITAGDLIQVGTDPSSRGTVSSVSAANISASNDGTLNTDNGNQIFLVTNAPGTYNLNVDNDSEVSWVTDTGGGGGITVSDEGTALATAATTLNFVGPGVTATGTGAVKTISISGGGSGDGGDTGRDACFDFGRRINPDRDFTFGRRIT